MLSTVDHKWPKARKVVFTLCLIAFVCQLCKISLRYYKYETEIQLKHIEVKERLDLPSITLCTEEDVLYLKSSLLSRHPEINQMMASIDSTNESETIKNVRKESVYGLYAKTGRDYKTEFNQSIKDSDFVQCFISRPTIWMTERKWHLRYTSCPALSPVLESEVKSFGKCFTFFTRQHLEIKDVSDLQINVKQIGDNSALIDMFVMMDELDLTVREFLFESLSKDKRKVFMFIHEANRMPSFDRNDAIPLVPGKKYDIRFWTTTKQWLKHPFAANCFDYNKKVKSKVKSKSKDQCFRSCYVDKSMASLGCLHRGRVLVNDRKLDGYNPKRCKRLIDIVLSNKYEKQCLDYCKQECIQMDYHFDYRSSDHNFDQIILDPIMKRKKMSKQFSIIQMRYKKNNDYEHRQRPMQSMGDTIQQLFLTLLIWFGLSIFSFSALLESGLTRFKTHANYLPHFEQKVGPNVMSVSPQTLLPVSVIGEYGSLTAQALMKPKFTATGIGSNVKLEHYNDFISKVVDGCPTAPTVDSLAKK